MTFSRPSRDQGHMLVASAVAARAACLRRSVGAVIVGPIDQVLSTGRNGTAPGLTNCSDGGCPRGQLSYDDCPAYSGYSNCTGYHAEDNAIYFAHDQGINLYGATIYVTHKPCDDCDEKIRASGIVRAVWPEGLHLFELKDKFYGP